MGVRVTQLTARSDARGHSFGVDVPFASIGDCHIATIRPGAVRGNHFHTQRREVLVVLYSGSWTLLWDEGEGTPVQSRTFTGSGAVLMEADPLCAHAVRNDGSSELQIFSVGDKAYTDTHPRKLIDPVTRLAGMDGCPRGWIAAVKEGDRVTQRLCANDDELLALFAECAVVAIDIPIGLTESGARACDVQARRHVRPRGASVFPAPIRAVLNVHTYAEANQVSRTLQNGKGMSKQAWMIVPKIAQIDRLLRRHPELRERVYEVHPEVTFAHWNREPLPSKHTEEGLAARRTLVSAHFGAIEHAPRGVNEDDLLDAYAALWSAERIAAGMHATLGDAHADSTGLPMRIVY